MSLTKSTEESSLALDGQTILVTGVSRPGGIGAAIAGRCGRAGARVAIHGNSDYDLKLKYPDATADSTAKLAVGLSEKGFDVVALESSDLADPAEPARVVSEAVERAGQLNGLVLNHAYSTSSPIGEWIAEHIDAHLTVNVRASMLMIQAFAKQAESASEGVITLFTSGQYLGPMVNEIAYAVSKEAIRGLCIQVAAALAPQQIRVNCINPGPTDTGYLDGSLYAQIAGMFPSGRWGTADDAARLVQFLHSEHARWITGQVIASEGGFRR